MNDAVISAFRRYDTLFRYSDVEMIDDSIPHDVNGARFAESSYNRHCKDTAAVRQV